MENHRRDFLKVAASAALSSSFPALLTTTAQAARDRELNILCWEGYNTDDVLNPFRKRFPGAKVRAESGTSDPDMINKLRAGEIRVWDLINVNQPWARQQLFPENLIRPLNRGRFEKYFEQMLPAFRGPYPPALSESGELLGIVQRFGPFCFVVNTDKISRGMAEDEGYSLFLDQGMRGRYGVLTYDNWNIIHMCLAAGVDPFRNHSRDEIVKFEKVARQIFSGAVLLTDDLVAMNTALVNGEIDAYFTGGTYTASPARLDGESRIRAITPKSGPINGKGGVVWVEVTSAVNNPDPSGLAEDFLEFVQEPDICKKVAFTEGTYNPVSQMGDEKVRAKFNSEELSAIQWDSLEEEVARSIDYGINPDYDEMFRIYTSAKRG